MSTSSRIRRAVVAVVASGLLAHAGVAGAQNNCDGNLSDFDAVYCYQKLFVSADGDLNDVYAKLMAALPASARDTLRSRQRAWIKRRDAASVLTHDGFKYVALDRATEMTVERVNELNDRLRECQSSGCRVSLLR